MTRTTAPTKASADLSAALHRLATECDGLSDERIRAVADAQSRTQRDLLAAKVGYLALIEWRRQRER